MLDILPAVDVEAGQAVRLSRGSVDKENQYGSPKEVAEQFIAAGTGWIHLVDLDAAFGRGSNAPLLAQIITLQTILAAVTMPIAIALAAMC